MSPVSSAFNLPVTATSSLLLARRRRLLTRAPEPRKLATRHQPAVRGVFARAVLTSDGSGWPTRRSVGKGPPRLRLSVVLDRPRQKRCDFQIVEKAYKNPDPEGPATYEQIFWFTQTAIRHGRPRGARLALSGPSAQAGSVSWLGSLSGRA
jgi:hypothetical protein